MIVEHVVIRGAEHGDDGEDSFSSSGDERLDRGASLQLDEV